MWAMTEGGFNEVWQGGVLRTEMVDSFHFLCLIGDHVIIVSSIFPEIA